MNDKLIVVCPNCKVKLSLQNMPGIQDKMLTCPKCKYKARVGLFQMGQAAKGGQGSSDDSTQMPSDFAQNRNQDCGQLKVVQTGQVCELRMGLQTIGRYANTSSADIQIGSNLYKDEYMSRRHVQIELVRTAHGIEHHLVEIGAKNPVLLNGSPVGRGDVVVLSFGDKLTLGKTTLLLEEADDEATIPQ